MRKSLTMLHEPRYQSQSESCEGDLEKLEDSIYATEDHQAFTDTAQEELKDLATELSLWKTQNNAFSTELGNLHNSVFDQTIDPLLMQTSPDSRRLSTKDSGTKSQKFGDPEESFRIQV